jgi:protein-histidine pros-kinase
VRALLISGEVENLERLSGVVTAWAPGAQAVSTAEAGMQAMQEALVRGEPPELIVLDVGDDATDAFAFAEMAAAWEGYEHAALAVMYSGALAADATDRMQTGIDAYVEDAADADQLSLAIRMAIKQAACKKGSPSTANRSTTGEKRLRILLVEDNPVNQLAASLLLDQWGHDVRAVGCGEEALSALAEDSFDVVLMDLEMPGISGIEATARIRQMGAGLRDLIVVAMTAHAMDSDRARCLQAGMDRFISKPYRPEQLCAMLDEISSGIAARQPAPLPLPLPLPAPENRGQAKPRPVWDRAQSLQLAGGSEKTAEIIVSAFLQDLQDMLPRAQSAALAGDAWALAAIAHRWKGSLGLLGANRAMACAARLEEACRQGEHERLLEYFQRLSDEMILLEEALSATQEESMK